MIKVIPPFRGIDEHGSGAYKASRGNHTHNGVDFAVAPSSQILSPVEGIVTKLGYAYEDDLSFRYVQITDQFKNDWRLFYVSPLVSVGDLVANEMIVGRSQTLLKRYPGITPHMHLEIKNEFGVYMNPMELLNV